MNAVSKWMKVHSTFRNTLIVAITFSVCCLLYSSDPLLFRNDKKSDATDLSMSYAVIIDAGSSGSRVYIYTWPPHSGNQRDLLKMRQLFDNYGNPRAFKIEPGLSSYADKTNKTIDHVKPLLDFAVGCIPSYKVKETPLYILATAGMRLLPKNIQDAILKDVRSSVREHYPFILVDNHVEVITGKDEGIYSWISVNYLLRHFNHMDPHSLNSNPVSTVGTLDMGGASMQIAFELPAEEYKKAIKDESKKRFLTKVDLGCNTHNSEHAYHLYVATYLGFGGNFARSRYLENFMNENMHKITTSKVENKFVDPCMPYNMVYTVQTKSIPFLNNSSDRNMGIVGSGNYQECRKSLKGLLNQSTICESGECKMNGIFHPKNMEPSHFYGFSEFWYTMEDILRMGGYYKKTNFENAAMEYCKTSWSTLKNRYRHKLYPKADENRFKFQCFKSAWMSTVLHEGFNFSAKNVLISASSINQQDVQWTLGALLYRMRFYPLRVMENVTTHSTMTATSAKFPYFFMNHYILFVCFIIVLAFMMYLIKRIHNISMRQKKFSNLSVSSNEMMREKRSWAIRHDVDDFS